MMEMKTFAQILEKQTVYTLEKLVVQFQEKLDVHLPVNHFVQILEKQTVHILVKQLVHSQEKLVV